MKYAIAFLSTIVILSILGSLLYFYFIETLIVLVCIIVATFIISISWAFGRYRLNEIIDPIREKYKMNTVLSKGFGGHQNIEDAARKNGSDIRTVKNLVSGRSDQFRRTKFVESLPEWIVKQALPFLAVSVPKWIIAIMIGVLVIRFHEDIIPHKSDEKNSSLSSKIARQIKISGDIHKGNGDLDSAIDIGDYCMNAHSNSNVTVLSNNGCH